MTRRAEANDSAFLASLENGACRLFRIGIEVLASQSSANRKSSFTQAACISPLRTCFLKRLVFVPPGALAYFLKNSSFHTGVFKFCFDYAGNNQGDVPALDANEVFRTSFIFIYDQLRNHSILPGFVWSSIAS